MAAQLQLQDDGQARTGLLIVGLGGNNGVTAVAGLIANQEGITWEGPIGNMKANYLGCITQLPSKGGSGGYRERYALADVNRAAMGGWDIRATKMGDALYNARVLDYDLTRQVRSRMNEWPILPGVWDPDFIGETQHSTADHVVPLTLTQAQRLAHLRDDIRSFKSGQKVTGHTTVIWSASVERPSLRDFGSAVQLMNAIEANDPEVSPSIVYAAAALLEGCSFVNGGSQNTMCGALLEMAEANSCYMLGTDFKAGQTKFKTAAVEYIRSLGLCPKVIASSNHLGNNDMLNLTTKRTLDAKMRVKSDIFAPWEEDIDHQVRVMYMRLIGDEKRDIVEYTSLGFMNCPHTMLTYTRAMDSALCVPLMIDAAVWCDFFARCAVSSRDVSRALAYLFKVPEGGAKGVDPGFFKQMAALEEVLAGCKAPAPRSGALGTGAADGGPMLAGRVVCLGISCLDLQLVGSTQGASTETINTFAETRYCPGGSCPQASTALAGLGVKGVVAITKMGTDAHGDEMIRQMEAAGVDCRHVIRDANVQTALAVLPIYANGSRGCFVNLAANNTFSPEMMLSGLREVAGRGESVGALLFGYPHFLPKAQGQPLADLLAQARALLGDQLVVGMDLNGIDNGDEKRSLHEQVLGPALAQVDILHANLEEAEAIAGASPLPALHLNAPDPAAMKAHCHELAVWFLNRGVKMVAITLGERGAYAEVSQQGGPLNITAGGKDASSTWCPAFKVQPGSQVNTNGAGDAFTAALVLSCICQEGLSLTEAVSFANLAALQRVDSQCRDRQNKAGAGELLKRVKAGDLPPAHSN